VEIPFQLLGWYTACSIFMGAFLLAFEQSLQVVGIATLMVHVGLGAVVYVGFTQPRSNCTSSNHCSRVTGNLAMIDPFRVQRSI